MELFDYLIEKSKNSFKMRHPFAHAEEYFRKIYAFGIGVLSMGHMSAIEEIKDEFVDFLISISLPSSYSDIILIELNNNFDFRINDLLLKIDTKQKQYCFFLDLYLVSRTAKWSREYAGSIIHYYAQAFRFSMREENFFRDFMHCARNNDVGTAVNVYENFLSQGHLIPYNFLTYAFPSFQSKKEYESIMLGGGKQLIIDRPTHVYGNINVENSSYLLIEGTDLILDGGIIVNGGKLQIVNSSIQIRNCALPYAISVKNTAGVIVDGLRMDGSGQCGFWHQLMGTLILQNCSFTNSGVNYGVYFSGRSLTIENCSFSNCVEGALYITGMSSTSVDSSRFISCHAKNGGGIFCDSMKDTIIKDCIFERCHAKFNGSAIYFKNQKFGQGVKNCETIDCTENTNAIFNAFSREVFK